MDIYTFDHNDFSAGSVQQNSKGKVFREAYAAAGATALTPYMLTWSELGRIATALADNTNTYKVGVPIETVLSGEVGWFQTGGKLEDLITTTLSVAVGHALEIHDGAVADEGADYDGGANEFAVCMTASTAALAQDVLLLDRDITATT